MSGDDNARLQIVLRGVLVAFVLATVIAVAPAQHRLVSELVAGAYASWAFATGVWGWSGDRPTARLWTVALFVDLIVLAVLTLLAGSSAVQSWTSDVLVAGFFLVPLLAALQLRPEVSTAVVTPTVAVYLLASALTKSANAEPWSSIILRTLILAGVACACVAVSSIQRSRMATISRLLSDRTSLLEELLGAEDRERRALSEHLHDGALQYVLAARYDLEDARDTSDPDAFARLERALGESSRLLRFTVSELHPAVLEQAGLARALHALAQRTEAASALTIALDTDRWDPDLRTSADALLYAAGRELLTNVVKHADAHSVKVRLIHRDGQAELTVADDGRGIPPGAADAALADGHIGLESHRVRIEAAGGTLTVANGGTVAGNDGPPGTVARVALPAHAVTA